MTTGREWQDAVGRNWAREWLRTDRSFAGLNEVLVERIATLAPSRLLDIGCGAGSAALDVAMRLPAAHVRGIDLSPDLVAVATERAERVPNVSFALADAAHWSDANFIPDTLMSRHGVMFFDDPVAAFRALADAASAKARMIFSCFREREANQWANEIAVLLPQAPAAAPLTPGPFSFALRDKLNDVLASAGWRDVAFEPVEWRYIAGAGDDPVADSVDFFGRIGPLAPHIRALEGAARAAMLEDVTKLAERHLTDGVVSFNAAAWIVTATKEA